MIKVVLLDADNVVVNKKEVFSKILARDLGLNYEQEVLPFFVGVFKPCVVGKADLQEILPPFLEKWGWQKSVEEFLNYWFKSENYIDQKMIATVGTLKKKGIKCYLATNQEKYRTNFMKEEMGFSSIFDGIFSSSEIGFKKPYPEFYQHVLKHLDGVVADEVIFWDDDEENVEGAKQVGIKACVYKDFSDFQRVMQEYLQC
jgi:putative hydrolase of the HAD superfamily